MMDDERRGMRAATDPAARPTRGARSSRRPDDGRRNGTRQRHQASSGPLLIVEDHADLRRALTCLFESQGYAVVGVADGAQALARLSGGLFPCGIVLDLIMPQIDGFAFREIQLRDARLAPIPSFAFSSDVRLKGRAEGLGLRFFPKPGALAELVRAVAAKCAKPGREASRS